MFRSVQLPRISKWFAGAITLSICSLVLQSPVHAALPNRIEKLVKNRIAPAWSRDETETAAKLLENLLAKLDPDDLAQVDAILTDEGVPNVGEQMLDARMRQVVARNIKPGKISPREAAVSMPVLNSRIESLLTEVEGTPFFGRELPQYETIKEYEDAFWEIHVASNKLRNAAKMSKFGEAITGTVIDKHLKKLSDDEIAELNIDFEELRGRLESVNSELAEIKAELRINAVTKATGIVRESKDFKERLRAAYVINFDGQQVIEFLRKADRSKLSRPLLRSPDLLESVMTSVNYARETAGDVAMKSRLLYLGMHWWMRGRYGEGPEGMGLLKSVEALRSPMARFPLYMPMKPPRPTDPRVASSGNSVPRFDRRHHYIWMYEYRSIQASMQQNQKVTRDGETRVTSVTKMANFY